MQPPLIAPVAPAWFRHADADGHARLGIARNGASGLELLDAGPDDTLAQLSRGGLRAADLAARAARAPRLTGEPRFLVPVAQPSKVLCLGKNFAAHAAELGSAVPEEPLFFAKLADALLPHGGTIVLPHWVPARIDHEIELAVVLGFAGAPRKYVAREHALELVAGYSILNDVTARDMQSGDKKAQKPWLRSKSFDTFGPFGPWVVPADALDPSDLAIELRVNGASRQASRTSLMVVGIADAIAYLSRHTSLRAGDVISMGTPEGVGPLAAGDVVVGEVEGIGRLVNRVVRESA